ncbi:SulP family inorganic anion transporter [Nocardioides sp. Y6]|uniref:SulP family inorganic anion transporter n=1 Tax=Nocardioides malaquae TaxID=2773426 RepID=A0ABR9RSN6_9ACTN|nr:SulP family inorganic anion transporter [Nocardioides malaquae]MBE7324556.1 SulP family inorganic anion transporter [Nocardioides malaquae]
MTPPPAASSTPARAAAPDTVRAVLRSPRRLRTEALAGLVVALALIPEAIAFSVIVGVDPRVGLFTSVVMALSIAFLGGRPAMISASTAAVAVVIAPVMERHGFDHLVATVILGGLLQVLMAVVGVARLMRFVPRSVMIGFLNALATMVLLSQVEHVVDVPWVVYPLVLLGLAVIVGFGRLTQVVPPPLVGVVVVTLVVVLAGIDVPTVGDQGRMPDSLPQLFWPDVPLTAETLRIIAPYAFAMAIVGLLESLLTAKLVDDLTDTHSDKTREAWGQGAANLLAGLFGGQGGCAVVGQTMMNVKNSGARTRVSTFLTGAWLLLLVIGLADVVARIPMAALVAVMVIVAVTAFEWHSITPATLRRMPRSETFVMVTTVALTLSTHNLAVGVGGGTLVAMVLFARRVAHLTTTHRELREDAEGTYAHYRVSGQLFFASSNDLYTQFDYADDPERVVVDLSAAQVWDASSVAALDSIETKYARRGKQVTITGLDAISAERHGRLTGTL